MKRIEYLIARGWRRAGEFESGKTRWVDPHGNPDGKGVAVYLSEEAAEQRQLDRDAAVRDYVDARRPRCLL